MRVKAVFGVAVVGMILASGSMAVLAQATQIDYDTFMQNDLDSRLQLFQTMGPENKAEVVRTQIARWLTANRQRLSPEQIAVVEDGHAFVTAELYEVPRSASSQARAKELETRTAAVLSQEDARQAFTINGAYISRR